MRSNISISVIMITYNHEQFIKEAIDGVLMQDFDGEIELMIADDNSPDNTKQIVEDCISKNTKQNIKIKYTKHLVNKGIMPNFIWILDQCKGKYIALCEGDDYWTDPKKLQKQVDFLEANEDYIIIGNKSERLTNGKLYKPEADLTNPITLENHIGSLPFRTNTFLFRNNMDLGQIAFTNFISGDRIIVFLNLLKGKGFIINEYMSVYRDHDGGVSKTTNLIKVKLNEVSLYNEMNRLSQFKYEKKIRLAVFYNYTIILKNLIQDKKYALWAFYFLNFSIKAKSLKELKTLIKISAI